MSVSSIELGSARLSVLALFAFHWYAMAVDTPSGSLTVAVRGWPWVALPAILTLPGSFTFVIAAVGAEVGDSEVKPPSV